MVSQFLRTNSERDTAKTRFADLSKVLDHLEAIRTDLIENVALFVVKSEGDEGPELQDQLEAPLMSSLAKPGAKPVVPIVEELHSRVRQKPERSKNSHASPSCGWRLRRLH